MRFLADENFDNQILKGLRNSIPNFDIVRVQDTEIYHSSDQQVLEWAAGKGAFCSHVMYKRYSNLLMIGCNEVCL
jgi:Domain of unknown function (DUF5615)